MSLPQISQVSRDQALADMIEALALQEAAWASLIDAEATKVDALVKAGIPAAGNVNEVNAYQGAVGSVLQLAATKGQSAGATLELLKLILADKAQPAKP
ncbi:MAG TPA: hypothetical protein VGK74_05915 [Symbiobacteriaceae bacterium]|jgi:NADPH-dependent curcumin reductase CurA